MKRVHLGALACLLALAGCGGPSAQTIVKKVEAQVAKHCTLTDYAIQCALPTLPAPVKQLFHPDVATTTLQGIDFAWTKFGPSQAGSFGASYASTDSSKDWNKPLVDAYHGAHKGTVVVWETSATRAAQGCAAGASDARSGEALLAAWGFPRSHLDMAIDFDASGSQVFDYFNCANQQFPGLIGAYGGFRPLEYLCAKGVIHKSWQTYAWSGGLWLPATCAPLEQYLNGSQFDHDRAIAADYGQFPTPAPPGPSQATISSWRALRNSNFTAYHKRHCDDPLSYPCSVAATAVVANQAKLWTVYKRWPCFGPRAKTKSEVCWIIRPEVSIWSHKRGSSQRAYDAYQGGICNAATQPPPRPRECDVLLQRVRYFNDRATSTVKAYS